MDFNLSLSIIYVFWLTKSLMNCIFADIFQEASFFCAGTKEIMPL
jgi:hypothetical protein